ncbi:hypothetical protein [Psychroflexus sediminis]|uniref:Uncharacterized protein n=1 Tax=Psychroflexus sediminis TaxID=470826 RepID=A0A1G7VX60_9FLAO|nr:hypothetical protein [Psychroflexus sediminis]SDG63460.1 hypothetical protein SAMN04488027_104173 [Psychroflexus sediminis]
MSYLSSFWRLPHPHSIGDEGQACLSKERRQAFGSRFLPLLKQTEEELQHMLQSLTGAYSWDLFFSTFGKDHLDGLKLSQSHFKEVLHPNFVTFQLKNH